MKIYIDADACPVKQEVYRVARRCEIDVIVVANCGMAVPVDLTVRLVVVESGDDVADDWIAERIERADIAITADIPLAARCLKAGARVVGPRGVEFTDDSIGSALAGRELSRHLREIGADTAGPPPLTKKDRSQFLNTLDAVVQSLRRMG